MPQNQPDILMKESPESSPHQYDTKIFGSKLDIHNEPEKFNHSPKWKDIWATILFILTFSGLIIISIFSISPINHLFPSRGDRRSAVEINIPLKEALLLFPGSSLLGMLIPLLYFAGILRIPGLIIQLSFIMSILFILALSIFFFISKFYIVGSLMLVSTILYVWSFYCWQYRIPFAKFTLLSITRTIYKYPATIFTGIIGIITLNILIILATVATVGVLLSAQAENTSKAQYLIIVFIAFASFWTFQVIKSTVHATVSGLFATVYFYGTYATGGKLTVSVSNPTAASAKRALTSSFGSICFGSMFISLIEILNALLRSAAESSSGPGFRLGHIFLACSTCIISCIYDIVQYFNHYAFTQVAIYGKSYCDAAKATWRLVKSKGIDAIINDSLINTVLGMGAIFSGAMGAGSGCVVIASSDYLGKNFTNFSLAAVVGFIICSTEFIIMSEVINSGVTTTFVCLAEDPFALQRTKPELYAKLKDSYPQAQL